MATRTVAARAKSAKKPAGRVRSAPAVKSAPAARRSGKAKEAAASTGFYGAGGFEGARRDRASLKQWTPRAGSPDSDTVPDLETLRSRSRDLARNAPLIAGALDTHLTSMIGPGLVPHPRIDREYLQLTDEAADAWQKQALRLWWAFAGEEHCDIRRRSNFAHLTWIVAYSWMSSGDHFVRRRFKVRPGDVLGLKLQLIEADRVSNPNQETDTPVLVEGVALGDDGEPLGVWVTDRHPGDTLSFGQPIWSYQPMFGPQTGEPLVLQIGLMQRDGQTRAVPMLAPVIESIKQLTRYAGAELDAAVVTSMIAAFITTTDPEGGMLPGMGTGSAGPAVGIQASAATASDDKQVTLSPAAVIGLSPGETITAFNPQRPNSGFDPFVSAFCSYIGAAVGLPYELLLKRFTSSYSASRGAMIEAWRTFKTKRSLVLVDQFAQPVYGWLITEAVARGYLDAPGYFSSPLVRQAYLECAWSGPIMGQLDPRAEADGAAKRIETGLSTLDEETAEMTGGDDWERKHVQRVKEHKLRVEGGLEPAILGATTRATLLENPAPETSADQQDQADNADQGGPPSTPPAGGTPNGN